MDLRESLRRDVVQAARDLLGAEIVHGEMRARIVETEAYRAEDDPACHGYPGRPTPRNATIFGEPGYAYVYLSYGMHWMLNVSAHERGRGAAVLIRAAEPLAGIEILRANRRVARDADLLNGPGKLCQAFGIDRQADGRDLLDPSEPLHLLPAATPVAEIAAGPRIGIAIGKAHDYPWRFVDAERRRWASRG